MKLFLIRHAQSANNHLAEQVEFEEYLQKRSPEPPITEVGERQARLVAEHLADVLHPEFPHENAQNGDQRGYGFTRLFCSPMLRTLQTTLPISQMSGLRPEIWVDIHEHGGMFHGNPKNGDVKNFPGLSRSEIQARFPGYQAPPEITEAGWWSGGYEPDEGCFARAVRVAETLRGWAEDMPEARIALVSHGTFVDNLLKALFGQDLSSQLYYSHYNTAITRIDFTPRRFLLLRYLNRTEHLPAELITR